MKIYLFILSMILISCEENDCCVNIDTQCYSFDIRQCQTDGFANSVLETSSFTSREAIMKRWLDVNGFVVVELKLELNFHEFVCEACDSCP
ncbi:MAG: hypothetical protein HKO66_14965, partial [Saprospiraceae bacterium]|nr:hypothetical protein [Saprospiraceae bacterium]